MIYRADKLVIGTHTLTHGPTDAADDITRRPKLASGKNVVAVIAQHIQVLCNVRLFITLCMILRYVVVNTSANDYHGSLLPCQ